MPGVSRRTVLMTGGAAVVVLGAGYAGHILTKSLGPARAPWEAAQQGFGDPRLDALAYAILAPNPHNMQPWLIELTGPETMTLYCDTSRLLPETDPPGRQITIGLGAFLELFRQAAAEMGYRVRVDAFPEGEPQPTLDERPVARITMTADANARPDPLFASTLQRRTSRVKFDARPVPEETLSAIRFAARRTRDLRQVIGWTSEGEEVAWLKALCIQGWEIEANLDRTLEESTAVTRIGANEVNANPDGISLTGPMLEVMNDVGVLTREGMLEVGSTAHQATIDFYNGLIEASPSFMWLNTIGNSRIEQLEAGATWVRLNQAATREGVSFQPLSQVLQEFPEMAGPYEAIHERLNAPLPARVQGLFRLGFAPAAGPSPRWPLESRLVSA